MTSSSSSSSPVFSLALFVTIFLAVIFSAVHCKVLPSNHKDNLHNYKDALSKSILYFENQRSGVLPRNQRVDWRGNSGLKDGNDENVDLVGGYYDAGDNVKFGFPMAFTTTMLSWGIIEFGRRMGDELDNAKFAVRWATDYLLKATRKPDAVYVQVGSGEDDHKCWERPEDMDTPRTILEVNMTNPGSDVAGETAAALAAASIVFQKSDPIYSAKLRTTAIRVFEFAEKYRGSYSSSLSGVNPFYTSYSGYGDELLWGATWLLKATGNRYYRDFIQTNEKELGVDGGCSVLSWDDKHAGVKILLTKAYILHGDQSFNEYKGRADEFICSLVTEAKYTPGGLLYVQESNNLQYATTASFILVTYAKYLKKAGLSVNCGNQILSPTQLRVQAKKQVDYILGDNPTGMSYMVGYGSKFPERVHHRGASMPLIKSHPEMIACNEGFSKYYPSSDANPNVLVGAVVGGPDSADNFSDDRNNFNQAEGATYTVASVVGTLAYLAPSYNSAI